MTYTEVMDRCIKEIDEFYEGKDMYGFFYHLLPGGVHNVGFYENDHDLDGDKVRIGPKGFIATRIA